MLRIGICVAARSSCSVVRNHSSRGTFHTNCFAYCNSSTLQHLKNGQKSWTNLTARYFSSGTHVVEMRGLDPDSTEEEVVGYFRSLNIKPANVKLRLDQSGRVAGTCEVEFNTYVEAMVAMRKKNSFIGNRFIRLRLKSACPEDDTSSQKERDPRIRGDLHMVDITAGITKNLQSSGHFVRMKGLPRRTTEQAIYDFFWPVNVRPVAVRPVYDENSRPTGEFDVEFLTHEEAVTAMSKNNAYFGCQFVELILNSTEETHSSDGISDNMCQDTFQKAKI